MRGADVHLRNKDGWTAFHIATRADHARHMRLLLDVDANVWRTCSNNGRTPLHTASLDCCTNALQVLLQ
jgi:ankyrin repeat protein